MSQLSSPMPPVPVAAPLPQSAASNATTRAGEQANAASVVDQFARLLEALAQTEQTTSPMMTPAAAGDQSAIPPGASAPLEADSTATAGTATAASPTVQPQVSLPEPLITAAALQAPDAQAVRPRDAASGKPKAEPATPARRAGTGSGQSPPSDSVAALQGAALVTPNIEPRQNSALRTTDNHAGSSGLAGTQSLVPPSLKSEELKASVQGPQAPEAAPMHLAPANLEANALAAPSLADASQSATQPARAAEPQAAASSTGQHTSPAAQITPALMQLGHAPDGAQRLTMRLDPPELGHVQIKIDRPSDAPARVEITVEKPETLSMLLRDQPQLQRTLDQAGVPVEGRNVTFHVATPEPASRSDTGTAPVPNTTAGGLTGDGSHGTARQHTQSGRRQHDATDDGGAEFTPIQASGWMRAGLDITA
jgi:flagellar hook-length control protein FliK